MRKFFILLIRGYSLLISPFLGQHCRFYPSCSEYAQEAIDKHGAFAGLILAVKRLCRCHPWHEGGLDPVPELSVSEPSRSEFSASKISASNPGKPDG
ncbi:MAG: membrane protein insertion efficiency factor YidD [Gammaproteobacteria bacterium]|nr:membrane protein insertion efficiency factor YidD [Gammaproteobacteria bacterium]